MGFEYNPAGQITVRDSDNDAYSYDAFGSVTIASVNNALNQTTSVGGVSTTHDNRGNMTNDGTHAYIYDALNRMTRRAVGEVLQYDAFNRLFQAEDGAAKRRFLYDPGSGSGAGSSEIIAEMTTAGVIEKRYVRGPGADEVLVEYDTTGVSDVRTWLYADERGSVIAGANDAGAKTFINTYDEFGNPASANTGSFQYTGQLWLTEVELYHYKARQYNPELGRFMQADPIGYGDGMNMYNYTGGDPINFADPSGLGRRGRSTDEDGGGGNTSCSRLPTDCGSGVSWTGSGGPVGTGGANASANAGRANRKRRGGTDQDVITGSATSNGSRGGSSANWVSQNHLVVTRSPGRRNHVRPIHWAGRMFSSTSSSESADDYPQGARFTEEIVSEDFGPNGGLIELEFTSRYDTFAVETYTSGLLDGGLVVFPISSVNIDGSASRGGQAFRLAPGMARVRTGKYTTTIVGSKHPIVRGTGVYFYDLRIRGTTQTAPLTTVKVFR